MPILRHVILVLLATALLACHSEPAAGPASTGIAAGPAAALVPLDPFGIGAKVPGSHGCKATAYRQFDFWVGKWDVFGIAAGSALAGTNVITSELDGCVVLENWRGAAGGRGRSLNAYDASTNRWSQMWVSTGGCPFGNIFIEGAWDGDAMDMSGTRAQPAGFLITQCPSAGTTVFAHSDRVRWTPLAGGAVLQQSVAANDASLPPINSGPAAGGLRYQPVAAVTAINVPDGASFCQFRPQARHFDFMVGSWDVHQGNGDGAQGTATFSKDLTNCLLEERFEGPGSYAGLSFNTYDAFTRQWYRTYVDNEGQRILMTGGLVNDGMVLQGTKPGSAGRSIEVRITWTPVEPARVVQKWEYSRDQGATWEATREVVYTKRS